MASPPRLTAVKDTVSKVNNEMAVGEDLGFQRRWWRFERIVWTIFVAVVVLDLLGAFGRGWLARVEKRSRDGMLDVTYERIERFSAPSILTVRFTPAAVHDGRVALWVSDSLVKELGAQRVIPQPASSVVGRGGVQYTFPVTSSPASVQFALQPAKPGVHHVTLRDDGPSEVNVTVAVMP